MAIRDQASRVDPVPLVGRNWELATAEELLGIDTGVAVAFVHGPGGIGKTALARAICHEIDHLDGVLMLDRAPRDQRKAALRALREGGEYGPSATEPAAEAAPAPAAS